MTENIKRARELAFLKHSHMKIEEGVPYSVHLENVVQNAFKFGFKNDEEIIIACYLHDSVEDTDLTLDEIQSDFGEKVADIVFRVTDEPGLNRKERKAKTYPKIKGHLKATVVKLCDRIANVEHGIKKNNGSFLKMYKKEHSSFVAGCKEDGCCDYLWTYLNDLIESIP